MRECLVNSIRSRLLSSFRAVFANYRDEDLAGATPDTIERWDSSNHFLLLQVVEEEFSIRIPETESGELLSFDAFETYLQNRV